MAVLVGKKAPLFEANAVVNGGEFVEKFSLEQFIGKKHVVFFFYPLDFTFVCPINTFNYFYIKMWNNPTTYFVHSRIYPMEISPMGRVDFSISKQMT